jgi:hypothetical protein
LTRQQKPQDEFERLGKGDEKVGFDGLEDNVKSLGGKYMFNRKI